MIRILGPALFGLFAIGIWIYALLDVVATDDPMARTLPKMVWVLIVLFLGPIGAIGWLGFGRPRYAGWRPGDTAPRPPRQQYRGPEDDPSFGR